MVNFKSRKCKFILDILISMCLEDIVGCRNVLVYVFRFFLKIGFIFYLGIS